MTGPSMSQSQYFSSKFIVQQYARSLKTYVNNGESSAV